MHVRVRARVRVRAGVREGGREGGRTGGREGHMSSSYGGLCYVHVSGRCMLCVSKSSGATTDHHHHLQMLALTTCHSATLLSPTAGVCVSARLGRAGGRLRASSEVC